MRLTARRWLRIGARFCPSRTNLSDFLIPGGLFETVCTALPSPNTISLSKAADQATGLRTPPSVSHSSLVYFGKLARILDDALASNSLGSVIVLFGVAIIGFWSPNFYRLVGISISTSSLPAFYGALAFGADQRRRQYRFLAEHAASPRYVWLARHVIWFGAMNMLCFIIAIAMMVATGYMVHRAAQGQAAYQPWGNPLQPWGYQYYQFDLANQVRAGTLFSFLGAPAWRRSPCLPRTLRSTLFDVHSQRNHRRVRRHYLVDSAHLLGPPRSSPGNSSGTLFLNPLAFGAMVATWLRAGPTGLPSETPGGHLVATRRRRYRTALCSPFVPAVLHPT